MNWLIIIFSVIPVCIIAAIIIEHAKRTEWAIVGACLMAISISILFGIGMPLGICKQNIHSKYDLYIEIRLKYAEAEGIEKEYLELNDIAAYNSWYKRNKEDLENPWNFKSAAGCEFDYIEIKGETK